MDHYGVVERIFELADEDFQEAGAEIQQEISDCSKEELIDHVKHAGAIPERFGHDSTEEKIFSKYTDIVFAESLSRLGFTASIIDAGGDAADLQAEYSDYDLVGDAKAHRLSLSTLNQKDLKIDALGQWRGASDYACLLGPMHWYFSTRSQAYRDSIRHGVTLLSYMHLVFFLRADGIGPAELKPLWELSSNLEESKAADPYWEATMEKVLEITGRSLADWHDLQDEMRNVIEKQAKVALNYHTERKKEINREMSDEMAERIIRDMKINKKVKRIKRNSDLSYRDFRSLKSNPGN